MTDTLPQAAPSALSFLRMPQFTPTDARSPAKAILHALPAVVFFVLNLWLWAMGFLIFIGLWFGVPMTVLTPVLAIAAIPCALTSWGLFVRCVEVEAALNR